MRCFWLALLCAVGAATASTLLEPLLFHPRTRGQLASDHQDIFFELSSRLSANASIFAPGSRNFDRATTRWQTYKSPNISMVVEVATEQDVQTTIQIANHHKLPFLAVGGAHGAIDSLGHVYHGVQIWTRKMNSIEVDENDKTATLGPGLLSGEVTDALWKKGKQAVTGACKCTGMIGPVLGGGHGWLQGRYGLALDNVVSARMVLANGTAIHVSSTSNPDLYWAIRGAGHNFGIVTQLKYQIYDVPPNNTWTVESFIFTGDKVEEIYAETNRLTQGGTQPAEFINFSYFIKMPEIDPHNLVIQYFILYEGNPSEERSYAKHFHKLGPVNTTFHVVQYPEVSPLTGNGYNGPNCQDGNSVLRFPINLKSYNTSAQRMVYNKFNRIVSSEPALNESVFLCEGYSLQAVKAIPEDSTAYPDRQSNLLVSTSFIYKKNATLDPIVVKAGNDIRDLLLDSSGSNDLHAYVNYAHGDETLEQMYGFQPWRLPRLKALKKRYDPYGRFNFYAPIY